MVFSQWALLDTCIYPVSFVLRIDINWIAAWTPCQSARLARQCTRAVFIDLTFCKVGNCGENACLTEVTAWHLHLCPCFGSSTEKCVRPYADWHRRSLRCNSSMFWGQSQARKEDLNHIPKQTTWDVVMAANCGRHGSLQFKWFREVSPWASFGLLDLWLLRPSEILKTSNRSPWKNCLCTRRRKQNCVSNVGFQWFLNSGTSIESMISNHLPNCDLKCKNANYKFTINQPSVHT